MAGSTWQTLTVPDAEKLDFRDIDAVDERTAFVLSIGPGEQSRIYKTSDAGATWIEQFVNRDPKAFFDAMAFWDAKRGVAVSDSVDGQFVILTTTDGGATWARVPATALPPALPNEGFFAASGTNVAVSAAEPRVDWNRRGERQRACCDRATAAARGQWRRHRSPRARPPASSRSPLPTRRTASSSAATTRPSRSPATTRQ